ncbi:MAG: hypothetical protein DDT19_02900 [Syntrophomonadaceae bacterium]|nr:hypothetical protein [Bacillota bacterium]
MEIRLVVISDNGQTAPYEFKTFREAADFLEQKADPDLVLQDEEVNDTPNQQKDSPFPVDKETITESTPEKKGFIERIFNS